MSCLLSQRRKEYSQGVGGISKLQKLGGVSLCCFAVFTDFTFLSLIGVTHSNDLRNAESGERKGCSLLLTGGGLLDCSLLSRFKD